MDGFVGEACNKDISRSLKQTCVSVSSTKIPRRTPSSGNTCITVVYILYLISSLHIQSASLCSKAELSDHKSMIFTDIISQAVRFLSKTHIRILRASLC